MAIITNTCTDTNNSFKSEEENNTSRSSTTTTSTTTDNLSLINTILADVNAVIPNYLSLVSSYRLLVGASEEIKHIPGVPFEIFERSVIRFDRAGTLIDTLNELLCCKIAFSSDLLSITCAPIDIVRLISDCISPCADDQCSTAEQIVVLEALRQTLFRRGNDNSCFGPPPEGITPTPPYGMPPAGTAPAEPLAEDIESDLETTEELETEVSDLPSNPKVKPKFNSPLTRRHI